MLTADWLHAQAVACPTRPALFYQEQVWDFYSLDKRVERLAGELSATGVQPSQRIAALLPNSPEFVWLVYALARLGAVLLPLNIRLSPPELSSQLAAADCAFLVHNSQNTANGRLSGAPGKDVFLNIPAIDLDTLPAAPPLSPAACRAWRLDGLQSILFTSGTTGAPKGAQLTFANHFYSAIGSAARLGQAPTDRWLAALPLYHAGGLALLFRSALYAIPTLLLSDFDPAAILHAIRDEGATLLSVVPTMLQRLLEAAGGPDTLARLRLILLGGAPAPQELLERSMSAGLNLAITYGMTETASQIATAAPDQVRQKPGSVGKPLLFNQVRILTEAGHELPAGQIGQIAVRGPIVMPGYLAGPPLPVDPDGLPELLTGDLGYLDEDGDLWVVQRRHDLILSGGENVYPAEVEAVLLAHPQVAAACVLGLPDPEWGQQVAAALVLRPGAILDETALLTYCRTRLAGYKLPRRMRIVEALPLGPSGKILRQEVADLFLD